MTPLLRTLFALLAIVSLSSPPAYAQPGNALHFRGNITDRDYASVTNTGNVLDISGALTMEAWIRPELKTGADEANKWSTIIMKGNYGYGMVIGGDNCQPSSVGRLGYWGQVSCGSVPYSTATVNFGRWNHVAVTISSNTATFYVNGIKSGTATVSAIPDGGSGSALYLGIQGTGSGNGFFKGDMDELRIWNVARTEAQIQAGMYNEVSASSPGLVAYYHFDQGIAGGNNAAVTTVTDAGPSHLDATLHNFLLSGSTSNWIESYAIVLPKLQDASGVSSSGFTAGWTAPQVGTWDTYLLDVATDKAFTQMVSGYNGLDAGNTTSYSVTGLSGASAYYWRVRADKTSVTGKGAYSSPYGSVTIPVAGKGKALTLESANSEGVQVTNNSYLDWGTSSFTVEAWIKRGSNSGHHTIAGRQTLSATGWYFRISNNKLSFATGQGGSYNYVDSDGSTDISDNNWHHVAAVLDASGKTLTLYIDGKPDKTQAFQLSTALNINTASDLGIGFKPYYGEYFNGSVDEVRLWTTARTQQQLQEFMNTPLKGTETGLLGYWNFEDGSGVYDICTNKSGSFSSTLLTADHDEWADGNIGYTAVTGFNAPLNLRLGGSDIAGQALPRAVIYSLPSHGRLFQTSDGVTKGDEITATSVQVTDAGGNPARVIYQPNTSYSGPDAFQYQVSSGTTFSGNTETVDITVGPNHAPTGISLSATVIAENSAAGATVGTLSTTDTDVPETFSYTFVTGGADNAAFTITGSTLSIHDSPDFETKNSYSLRIRTTDQGGAFFDKDFTITITDINEAPSDIALSATSINENITAGSTVGTLSTTDPDAANTFTYTFAGGADDAAFTITGNTLSINATPDFESKSSYTVKVRSADQGTLSFEKTFTITINNVNETPADIILSATSINENITAGSTVGTLSTTDPDAANTFTYSFAGGADDAAFTITGNTLSINASPDFESKSSYTIKVRSADQGTLSFEKTFTITINNVNETPSDITLSATAINENITAGSTVGTLSTTDPDAVNTFTYTFAGGADDAAFTITGNTLYINASPDFESKSSYTIKVRSADQGTLSFEKTFTIMINNVNETPSDITLSATSINENVTAGSTVGTFTTTDPDAANTFTYSFAGGADDAAFTITGNALSINAALDFESKSSYTIKVRSADQGTLSFEKTFTITINNVNEAPSDIILSATSINENVTAGSTVGTLTTTDPDAANTFTYSFAGGADDAAFTITGNTLSIHASPDFESKNSYTIKVRSADQAGLFFEKTFVITINDMDEIAPGVDATGIPADGYYTSGTQLDFTLHFTENVFVNTTGGIPSLTVMIGSRQVAAMYISGSGSNTLLFRYTVHDNDEDMDGISTGALVLNGATIQDNMNNNAIVSLNDTTLSHVKVDAVPPSVISLERTEGSDTVSNKTLLVYRLRFSEEVTGVDVNDFLLAATGTVTAHIANVSSSGAGEWNITADNIRGDGRLQLILPGTGTAITDLAGNNMTMSLTGEAVTIDHTPPQTPVINSVNEDTGNKDTYITHTPVLTIAGKAEAGSLITVTSAATSLSFTTVTTREGDWSVSTGMSFAEGEYPIRVVSADAAGNNSIPAQLLAAIDTTMPFVQRISITEALPADYPALIRYTVYFSEPVHGLSANNFTLLSPGITGAAITDIQTSGTSAVLTVDPGTGSGSIRLDIVNSLSVKDAAGNPLKGLPVEGERYIINRPPAFAKGAAAMLLLCENATGVSIDSLLAAADTDKEQPITWSVTKAPMHGSVGGFPFSMVSAGEIMRPSGYTYIPFRGYHGKDSFSIKLSDGMAETVMTVFVTVRPLPVMPALFNISQSEVCPAQQNIAYSVEADDSLQYLWKYTGTGVTIHDSNSNLIHLSFTDSATSGTLSVTSGARNGCGLPATIAMQVMVNRPVAVTADPRNQAACEGQRMIFIVNAAGTGLHYQWQVKKENGFENITDTGMYTGYQSDTLVIPAAKALMDGYIFRCLVSGTCSATASGMATLSVSTPATILLQPADTSICYGTDALFTILATGVHNRYTWQVNDGNGFSSLADNNLYSGSTSDKLTIHAPGKSFYGYRYRVLVTNSCHTLTPGEATLTFASSWTGTADSDWDNPANWSCNTVPDKHTDVVINASAPRMPVISSAAMVNNLLIGAGAAVDLAQGSSLQTYGNVSGNGSFNAGKGLVVFAGTGPQNIPAGTYDSLQLDGGGMKALNGNVTVNGALLLSKGKLVLGNHNLQLSAKAGMQHYDSSSFIVTNGNGTVLFTQVGTAGVVFPVGANTGSYTPVTIINASGKPEDFEVKVIDHIYHNYKVYAPYNGTIGNSYVDKTWFIRKASAGASNITVRFQWNAADELPGFDRTMAAVSHYLEPDSSWMLYTAQGAAGTGPFTVQQEGIGAFSPFSISSTAPGLPEPQFQWLSSIVSASGQAVLLQWTTHNEKGGAFRVERSSDGFSFSPAFTITKTTGGIASTGSYSIRDVQVHPGYRYYYRIVYTDNSGKTYTSPILQLALNGEARNHLVILGNPFRNRLQYRVTAQSAGRVAVYLTDIAGHRLLQKEEQVLKGENLFLLTGSERLASGTYLFNMVIDGELMEKRIIKAR